MTTPVRRILIIDDEPALRRAVERALLRSGYAVLVAADGETAYGLLQSEPVDAVLLDYQMPGMSGMAVYHALVHRWPHLTGRILVMTGDPQAEDLRFWAEQQGCAVLAKPFTMTEVCAWLEHALDQPRRHSGER